MDYIFLLLGYILKASLFAVDFAIVAAVCSFGLWCEWIDFERGVRFPFFVFFFIRKYTPRHMLMYVSFLYLK